MVGGGVRIDGRLWRLDKFSNRVQFLLFPTETWNDKKLSLLQMYKAHVGKLGTEAVKVRVVVQP